MSNMIFDVTDEFFLSMAVFSAFIDKGMRMSPAFAALAYCADNEIKLVEGAAAFSPFAVRLERAILETAPHQSVARGAFEQEVCEPFGTWYVQHCAEHGGTADECVCRDRMANAIIAYFSKGLVPLHCWSIVRAVKAEAPSVRLNPSLVADSINWEWAPWWCEITAEIRACEQHPLYRRSEWKAQPCPPHISEYWSWVEYSVQAGYVRARYEALAGTRNIFAELFNADKVLVDGLHLRQLQLRRELVAQECIDVLPAHTVFSSGLFLALPGLYRAFCELNAGFSLDDWIARPVSDFLSEYAKGVDPDTTTIVAGCVARGHSECPVAYTMKSLWNAEPENTGGWRLEDGTVLSFQPDEKAATATAMRSDSLAA